MCHWEGDAKREGFPQLTWPEFVGMFCRANACKAGVSVNRIGFEFTEETEP